MAKGRSTRKRNIISTSSDIDKYFDDFKNVLDFDLTYESRYEITESIRKELENNNIALVLGAGVSSSCGLPNWNSLVKKLFFMTQKPPRKKNFKVKQAQVMSDLFNELFHPNALIMARYLRTKLSVPSKSKLRFIQSIKTALYDGLSMHSGKDRLINSLASLCCVDGQLGGVDSVVTYNYDDLLEEYIKKQSSKRCKSIFQPKQHYGKSTLPIFHVHGFLPQRGDVTKRNGVVLSEETYHKQYNEVYDWSNIVQIEKFKNNMCLFIGLSFTDPNQRRLLEIACNQRDLKQVGFHYAIMKRFSRDEIKQGLKEILKNNKAIYNQKAASGMSLDSAVKKLYRSIHDFYETDLASLHTKILWVNDFAEIPVVIDDIIYDLTFERHQASGDSVHHEPSVNPLTEIPKDPTSADIVRWVYENFEDPAEGVPYESREGGFQFVFGGNYEIWDIVQDYFGDVDAEILEKAEAELSGDNWEWVRKGLY